MQFCSKCGTQLVDGARFCPKCGAQTNAAAGGSAPVDGPRVPPTGQGSAESFVHQAKSISADSVQKIFAVAGIVVALLTLLPWMQVSYYIISGSYSIFDFVNMVIKLNGYITSGGYSSGADAMMVFNVIAVILALFWAAAVVMLVINCVRAFTAKKIMPEAFLVSGILAAVVIVAMFAIDIYVTSQVSSSISASLSTTGLFSATPWAWITAIASFAAFFVHRGMVKR